MTGLIRKHRDYRAKIFQPGVRPISFPEWWVGRYGMSLLNAITRIAIRRGDHASVSAALLGVWASDQSGMGATSAPHGSAQAFRRHPRRTAAPHYRTPGGAILTESIGLHDQDGYPTAEALARLASLDGSARVFIEYATSLYQQGCVVMGRGTDNWGNPFIQIRFITHGHSAPEAVSATIVRTPFHQSFWESSHRGGLTEYRVRQELWEQPTQWGSVES